MPNTQTGFGSPEQVHIENEWYDGPRNAIADIGGRLHRFVSQWDESEGEYLGTCLVWPVAPDELVLGREQWLIFVAWNDEYEAGRVGCNTHPGQPSSNARWHEIDGSLKSLRETVPLGARPAKAQAVDIERDRRYAPDGPQYRLAWRFL
jgi:hypothetical protein